MPNPVLLFLFLQCAAISPFCLAPQLPTLRDRLQGNTKMLPMIWPSAADNEEPPMRVWTGIYIESLGNFRATEMSFDVDLYLYLSWHDPSLAHSETDLVMLNDPQVRQNIWLPDLYFPNAHISRFHEVIAPNLNVFINQNGTVAYSTRITLSVACNLELSLYPMDSQRCQIEMLSYAYVEKQLRIRWFDHIHPTRHNPNIQLPEFRISNITSTYCNGNYKYAIMEHSFRTDNFSCLMAIIHLNRQIGYHVVQSFIPTGLIVIISWVSFWIDRRAVPARVTLSFTTMLSLSTLGNGLRFGLPQVAYAKAIDFWFGACMCFVFLSLLEFAAVNSYMREAEKYERFASYIGKKNSLFVKELSRNLSIKMPKIPRKIMHNWEKNVKRNSTALFAEEAKSWERRRTAGQCSAIGETSLFQSLSADRMDISANNVKDNNKHLFDWNPLISNHFLRQSIHFSRKGLQIDRHSRWLFPVGFALWNFCYWAYYLWYIQ